MKKVSSSINTNKNRRKRKIYSAQTSGLLLEITRQNNERLHVMPLEGNWVVKRSNTSKTLRKYKKYSAALQFVKEQLLKGSILGYTVHNEHGLVSFKEVAN